MWLSPEQLQGESGLLACLGEHCGSAGCGQRRKLCCSAPCRIRKWRSGRTARSVRSSAAARCSTSMVSTGSGGAEDDRPGLRPFGIHQGQALTAIAEAEAAAEGGLSSPTHCR
jgi:hypothetical protein